MDDKNLEKLKRLIYHESQIELNTAIKCGKKLTGIADMVTVLASLERLTHIIEDSNAKG